MTTNQLKMLLVGTGIMCLGGFGLAIRGYILPNIKGGFG